jgi:8-oxo-dGTP pyrophosphatase MutT (NUDIX family)
MTAQDFDPTTVPIRPAATVMLLRDHPINGVEVFMLQRTLSAAFAKGMYVFPGGRVDANDAEETLEAHCDGMTDEEASALLGLSHGGLSYWVAVIRECFEEAGVLLARCGDTADLIRFEGDELIARYMTARHAVHEGSISMLQFCVDEDLHLITDNIHYVSHWITPLGEARRFDTRFFVARAPDGQEPLHDDNETIDSLWVTPADALERHSNGSLAMMPPTIRNLEFLLPFGTTADALVAAKMIGTPTAIVPQLRVDEEGRVIGVSFPGDADFKN